MITDFQDKLKKPRKNYEKNEMLSTILKSFDTFDTTATTSKSVNQSVIGIGLIVIPKSCGNVCGMIFNKKKICGYIRKNIKNINNILKRPNKLAPLSMNYIENVCKILLLTKKL